MTKRTTEDDASSQSTPEVVDLTTESSDDASSDEETLAYQPPKPKRRVISTPNLWQVTGVSDTAEGLDIIKKALPKSLKKCTKDVAHFFLFVYERQMVWERRNNGDYKPYTESVAMQRYFFCNVSTANT